MEPCQRISHGRPSWDRAAEHAALGRVGRRGTLRPCRRTRRPDVDSRALAGSHRFGARQTAVTGLAVLPIRRRDEGDFIGYCGLIVGRSTAEEPEIAYELLRRAHGH